MSQKDDLISRQAAIGIVRNIIVKEVTPAYMLIDKAEVMTALMSMPSAQPPTRCIAKIKIDKDELEELVAKSMTNITQQEQFNPCIICQEFDCTGCKFRRT